MCVCVHVWVGGGGGILCLRHSYLQRSQHWRQTLFRWCHPCRPAWFCVCLHQHQTRTSLCKRKKTNNEEKWDRPTTVQTRHKQTPLFKENMNKHQCSNKMYANIAIHTHKNYTTTTLILKHVTMNTAQVRHNETKCLNIKLALLTQRSHRQYHKTMCLNIKLALLTQGPYWWYHKTVCLNIKLALLTQRSQWWYHKTVCLNIKLALLT